MEGKLTKRRRIYSVEPNKIAQAEFTRIYLSHLVPALMKLNQSQKTKKKNSTIHSSEEVEEEDDDDEKKNKNNICVNVVKHEVGTAMVWSAPPGFAWSEALKANVGIINDPHHNNAPSSPYNFSASPTAAAGSSSKSRVHDKEEDEQDDKEENEDEEALKRLRRLIPGGEEMGDDEEEMARELESYISCLQMQVNILQHLAHATP